MNGWKTTLKLICQWTNMSLAWAELWLILVHWQISLLIDLFRSYVIRHFVYDIHHLQVYSFLYLRLITRSVTLTARLHLKHLALQHRPVLQFLTVFFKNVMENRILFFLCKKKIVLASIKNKISLCSTIEYTVYKCHVIFYKNYIEFLIAEMLRFKILSLFI